MSGLGQAPPPPPAPEPAGAPVAQDALVAFAGTLTGQASGMHLYRRGDLVARGQVTEATPLRQTLVLTYQGRSPDRLLLQIFNYAPVTP